MRKTREYECPHCGEYDNTVRTLDFDSIDIDADANGDDYEFISQYCACGACGHHWKEYLRLTYDGCYTDGRIYDKNGIVADPEEITEIDD